MRQNRKLEQSNIYEQYIVENVTKNESAKEWSMMTFVVAGCFSTSFVFYFLVRFKGSQDEKIHQAIDGSDFDDKMDSSSKL